MKLELTRQQRNQVENKMYQAQEKRLSLSSDLADEKHHRYCEYKCCGSHEFQDYKNHMEVCPKCGMTEKTQDQHNDEWWGIVDAIEANDHECSLHSKIEYLMLRILNGEKS